MLGMVVDVENLFMSVHKEEDTDTKQVYFYLFKVCSGGRCRFAEKSSDVRHVQPFICHLSLL